MGGGNTPNRNQFHLLNALGLQSTEGESDGDGNGGMAERTGLCRGSLCIRQRTETLLNSLSLKSVSEIPGVIQVPAAKEQLLHRARLGMSDLLFRAEHSGGSEFCIVVSSLPAG